MKAGKNITAVLLFIIFWGIYYAGSFDKVPFGDCMGFVLDTEKNNFILKTTSTAHFLYLNISVLTNKVLHLGGLGSTRILSTFSGALTVALLFLISFEIIKNKIVSIVGAIIFGFGFSFWRNAGIPEVYTFNSIFLGLYLLFSVKLYARKDSKFLVFAGVVLGISLWAHIQNILLIPAFLYSIFLFKKEKNAWLSLIFFTLILAGLFIQPFYDGISFKYVFKSGSWVENSLKKSFLDYLKDILKAFAYLIYNFWHFIILGILGVLFLIKKNLSLSIFLLTSGIPIFGFATFYAVSDNYVFFIGFNLIFAISCAIGLNVFIQKKYFKFLLSSSLLIPVFYILSYNIALKIPQGKEFNNFKNYKGGLKYYLLPWIRDNKGIIEFTMDKTKAPEETYWMTESAEEYIQLMKSKGYSVEDIKKW